jgi:hypothetical protein
MKKLYEEVLNVLREDSATDMMKSQFLWSVGPEAVMRATGYAGNAAARIKWMQLPKHVRDMCPAPGTPGGDECVKRIMAQGKLHESAIISVLLNENPVLSAGKFVGGIAAMSVFGDLTSRAMQKALDYAETMWSEAARKCVGQQGALREMCINRQRLMAIQKKRSIMNSIYNNCTSKLGSGNGKCIKMRMQVEKLASQEQVYRDNVSAFQSGAAMSVADQLKNS